jgi:hypothetical protein
LVNPIQDQTTRSRSGRRVFLAVVAIVAITLVVLLLIFRPWDDNGPGSTAATATASPSASPYVADDCDDFGFTVLADSYHVDTEEGATFSGTACLEPGEYIMAFDYDPDEELFYLDTDEFNNTAIIIRNGNWSWTNQPLGNAGDVSEPQIVHFVRADSTCSMWVNSLEPNDNGDRTFESIEQHNCEVIAQETVYVTDN